MIRLFLLLSLLICFSPESAFADSSSPGEFSLSCIQDFLNEAEETTGEITLPKSEKNRKGQQAAEAIMEAFQSRERQKTINLEQNRLKKTIFKEVLSEFSPTDSKEQKMEELSTSEQLYVFISSSVPLSTLRTYASMIARANDPNIVMVLRGFVGGMKKIQPTMEFIGEMLKENPDCDLSMEKCASFNVNIHIDPLLFRQYQIKEVPAVVYVSEPKKVDQNTTPDSDGEVKASSSYTIHGDASLDYLLERINREVRSDKLDKLIASLRGGINYQKTGK